MKVLYYSVHAILEYDEIRMLHRLGHDVVSLGVYFGSGRVQSFRDEITFNDREIALYETFAAMGGAYQYGAHNAHNIVLPAEFVAQFDVVIVMDDINFIAQFWPVLSQRPVIWRTIGQNIDGAENVAAKFKSAGLHIVRYSPMERKSPQYCGETALIRFCKESREYGPWTGHAEHVLTFSHLLAQRYPSEEAIYTQIVEGFPSMLGGEGNQGMKGAIGTLSPAAQKSHYDHCRAYLYCSGKEVPYTLNFIEAMMTGIPIVGYAFANAGPYYEVPALLADGGGLVASSISEAREQIAALLADKTLAAEIGGKGHVKAIQLFGSEGIDVQWRQLLDRI